MNSEILALSQNKTRITIVNTHKSIEAIILHLFNQNYIDYNLASKSVSEFDDSKDFVLFFQSDFSNHTKTNIALVLEDLSKEKDEIQGFYNSITAGGIVILPKNNQRLNFENVENQSFFRKLTFSQSTDNSLIETELGEIELSNLDKNILINLKGIELLCQQVGIINEDFHEALLSINFY